MASVAALISALIAAFLLLSTAYAATTSASTVTVHPSTAASFIPTTTTTFQQPPPSPPPPPPPSPAFPFSHPFDAVGANLNPLPSLSPYSSLIPLLTQLGFHDLAVAAHSISSPSTASWPGPYTIFAPTDSALHTCPTCSPPLLLQEHSVPGLYTAEFLSRLAFGTKIETVLPGRCLTVTSAVNGSKIFVGGAEITRPDMVDDGRVVVHGIQGFLSHLSPYSCSIDKMTSLAVPRPSPSIAAMRLMLTDAMVRLRTSGYSILALALRVKYPELVVMENITVFALEDAAIFHAGHPYVRDVRFHIVPNRRLLMADLEKLPASTVLPTLQRGESLVVTTASGGGILAPMRLNYVRIKIPDLIHNLKIVVHGLAVPFPHLRQTDPADAMWTTASSGMSSANPTETVEPESMVSDSGSGEQTVNSMESSVAAAAATAMVPPVSSVGGVDVVPGRIEAGFEHGL